MVVVFSVVMMMKVAVNSEEAGERGGRGGTSGRRTARWNKSKKKITPIHGAAVCRCARPRFLSRVCIRATATLPQPHTLGYITRRDLYSRLTSLCEGRIRSDTSLVCTRTVRLCFCRSPSLSLSLSLFLSFISFFPSHSFPRLFQSVLLRWFVRWFRCNDSHPALSTLPSSSRLHEDPIRRL